MRQEPYQPREEQNTELLPEGSADSDIGLSEFMGIIRRRWTWILGTGLIVMAAVLAYQWDLESYPVYTAEVLVQRLPEATGLDALGLAGGARRLQSEISSELQILRTDQVLGQVVDSTGLRLKLVEEPGLRSSVFSEIDVSSEAASREYQLERTGGEVVLSTGGQEVARSGLEGMLTAPGLFLVIADGREIPSSGLQLEVVDRRHAILELNRSLDIRQPDQTNLIRIEYTGGDPVSSARVANAVAEAYRRQAAERARQEARTRREFLAARLESVSDSLEMAQEVLLDFQARSSTLNPESEGQTLSGMLLDAEAELRTLRNRERTLEGLLESLYSGGREGLRQMTVLSDEVLRGADDLYNRLQEYEDRRSELLSVNRRTENSPQVLRLDSLISETRAEMQLTIEEALRLAEADREAAEARVGELRQQVGDVPERNVAFGRLEQRVAAIQKMHDMLAERFYEAQISEAVEAGNIQIVDRASVPSRPSGVEGNRINPLLSLLGGCLLGFGIAVVYEKLDTRIRTEEQVRRAAGAEIVGRIPDLVEKTGESRPIVSTNGTVAAESFRMLRTNMRFVRAKTLRAVGVTSPGPGEGKSVISGNLAIALANEGKKVLLLDADMRRPVQHAVFGLDREPGLSNILIGEKVASVVRQSQQGIDIITAGTKVPNPAELESSSAFQDLLDRAKERYDVIVVDTPPVLAVSDTSVIAPLLDGIILVARHGQTHRGALSSAADQLRRAHGTVLGVVVNGASASGGYGYGYGYGGSYYGYGASEYLDESDDEAGGRKKSRLGKLPFVGKS